MILFMNESHGCVSQWFLTNIGGRHTSASNVLVSHVCFFNLSIYSTAITIAMTKRPAASIPRSIANILDESEPGE